jgi:hypothetical protein
MKKIAIIGSGFFGLAATFILSKKYNVDLYEKKKTILNGASSSNQFRFHLGYHYPRSTKTLLEVQKTNKDFIKFYGKSIFGKTLNYYGVSKINSQTSFNKYINFLKMNKLYYKKINLKEFSKKIEGSIISKEKNLNFFKIKKKIEKKLLQGIKSKKVKLLLNTEFKKSDISKYDKIIIATYDQNNLILKKLGYKPKLKFKYELVEKTIIKLQNKYKNKSYMIIDGKFICLDPYLGTNYHLLSSNKFSKIEVKNSYYPNFSSPLKKFVNKGMIKNKKISGFNRFIKHGAIFLDFLKNAKYIGSFYLIRAIEANKEKTDERLNRSDLVDNKIITLFSGKWNTSISVALDLLKKIK